MFKKIRAAAEKGARDEVRREMRPVMNRLVKLVEKAEANGLVAGAKGPAGVNLGEIYLKIPDVAGGISAVDVATLRTLLDVLIANSTDDGRGSAIAGMCEILNEKPLGLVMQMDLDTGEIEPCDES